MSTAYRTNAKSKEEEKKRMEINWRRAIVLSLKTIAVIIVGGAAMYTCHLCNKSLEQEHEQFLHAPCSSFKNYRTSELPARCIPNFPDK